ncbi:MAG: HEAT repeat domain-containing protein, partial [Planctomycetota bacterium]
ARFTSLDKIVAQKLEDFALDPIRNWEAAEASLVREKVEGLHDPIRYYLLDVDWEVQAFVCYYAGRRGLVDLLPEIEETYDEAKFAIIRRKAVEAAVAFAKGKRGAEAHEFLKKGLIDKEPGVRLLAVEGLETLKDKESLATAKKDKDHDTRYRALGALAHLGDQSAQEQLLKGFMAFAGSKDLQRRASLETEDVGERYAQFLNAIYLGYWGGEAGLKQLSMALQRKDIYRNKLFLAIGSAVSLGKARPASDRAKKLRARALKEALGGRDAVVRAMAAFAAGYTLDEAYVRPLQLLTTDAQLDVRHNAVEALGRIPGERSLAVLLTVIKAERDVPVRLACVRALSRHPEDAAVDGLIRGLKDKRYMVRASSAQMLGRRGSAAARATRALLKSARDQDFGVREAAVVALARIGTPEALPGIVSALKDRDAEVRIRAMRALGRYRRTELAKKDKDAAVRVVKLYVSASKKRQREAASKCLLAVRSPHAVPPLLAALQSRKYGDRNAALKILMKFNRGDRLGFNPKGSDIERNKGVKRWKEWWAGGGPISAPPPAPTKRANQDILDFHRYTRDLRWRGVDLVLAYDSTGSMLPVIRAVKQRLDLLIEESAHIVTNLRMSLFTYRDEGEEYIFYGTPLTHSLDNLKAFVQVAEANRGGDLPEAVTATVDAAVNRLDWREDAQKVIVIIGDAPYHPERRMELFKLARDFKKRRGVIHAIYTDPARLGEGIKARRKRQSSTVSYPFLDRLDEMARESGGRAITIEDTRMLISEILVLSFGEEWRDQLESRIDFE